jgi:hypothetical protein
MTRGDIMEEPELPAVRLIFKSDGDEIELIDQQQVDIAVTGHDLVRGPHPGRYIEIRGDDGRTLSRLRLPAAAPGFEVFPERQGDPIRRVGAPERQRVFDVVLPAPQDADHVSFVRIGREAGERATHSADQDAMVTTELARFPLHRDDGRVES